MSNVIKMILEQQKAGVQEHSGFTHSLVDHSRLGSVCLSSVGSSPTKPEGLANAALTWLGAVLRGLWIQCWGKFLSSGFSSVQSLRGQAGLPYMATQPWRLWRGQ